LEEIAALGREIPTISDKPPQPAVAPFDEKMAKRHQKLWARHLNVAAVQTNSLGMKLVLIPPGEFMMGSPRELIEAESLRPDTEEWYKHDISSEGPQHRVRITKPYWLGVTPVTQEEYQRVMGNNPSGFRGVPTRPVEQVSWVEAMDFCRKLSDLHEEKAAKRRYGLPTEAQWEYACRAGSTGRWCFSNQPNVSPGAAEEKLLDEYAWFTANASRRPHPVGQKRANAWGLYDMHGNVWQWCADWNGNPYYANSTTDDPAGPESGQFRVNRGGCWFMPAECSRSACRGCNLPEIRGATIGFRVCLLPASK
jgi:formylglycine-generating enzyme required for sulfatase activity